MYQSIFRDASKKKSSWTLGFVAFQFLTTLTLNTVWAHGGHHGGGGGHHGGGHHGGGGFHFGGGHHGGGTHHAGGFGGGGVHHPVGGTHHAGGFGGVGVHHPVGGMHHAGGFGGGGVHHPVGGVHHAGGFAGGGVHHPVGGIHHPGVFIHHPSGGGFYHGGLGYRGFWHPNHGYWHSGWATRGWYANTLFPGFYPGWYYGWYGSNPVFSGSGFYFGYPYYRPFYLPSNFAFGVAVGSTTTSMPSSTTTVAAAPYGGESDQEPVMSQSSQDEVKAIIEQSFQYASSHASTFWKFCSEYPTGYDDIDAYFNRFAIQKNEDLSLVSEAELKKTISFGDRCGVFFCGGPSPMKARKASLLSNIKQAYRNKMVEVLGEDPQFNSNVSNMEIACNALYTSISKRYSDSHSNIPLVFDLSKLQEFFKQLESNLDSRRLTRLPTSSSKEVPQFIVQ